MAFDLQEKYIREAEALLNCKLPSSYKNAMQESNGGVIEIDEEFWELFPIADKSDKKRLSRSCNNIITETKARREWANFPENALAIAADGSGDLLIFKKNEIDDSYIKHVYMWYHETGNVEEVTSDFKDLDVE